MAVAASRVNVHTGMLREVRSALLSQRRLRGRRFCDVYTDAVDEWLVELFTAAVAAAGRGDVPAGVALVAVGGYGRRELCPGSDLDLVLVHDRVRGIGAIADALWYPIWDAGINMDHSVRTPKETVSVIGGDLKSALSLLNARVVAGDQELGDHVIDEARRRWAERPEESLGRLRASLDERWAQHGELAFLLEPDVKLARGGLRDLEVLKAAALAAPVARPFLDDPGLEGAGDELLAVRVALHATTGRRSDRLVLEEQDAVARRLGFADADELLPDVAAAGRRISWATDQIWRRIDTRARGPNVPGRDQPLEAGIELRGDELVLDGTIDPGTDGALALRIAAASARTGYSIAASALAELESHAKPPAEPWPPATRDALLDLLGCGRAAVPLLETLDHIGVLGRYVREWQAVRAKPQRNVYHRYTVDRHLCEAAAEAAELTRAVHRPDLLLVAAWLHDVGKGFPGDHTEAGARVISDIALRMGFDGEDVATLVRLVHNHLLLADTAMRRDLSDPATVEMVAERVGSVDELELLAALTKADSIATGPSAWGTWKATLVEELVVRTRGHIQGERHETFAQEPTAAQRSLMGEGRLRVLAEGSVVTVVAPDRPGLLAIVSGVLAANRLPVRAATGLSENAMAVEVFDVDLTGREPPDEARLTADLVRAFEDPRGLEERLVERARSSRAPRRPGAAHLPGPRVLVDNHATRRATIVEVRAPDGVGVLSRIAGAIAASGCDITVVRALTLGHEVVDTFYVTDGLTGAKVTDPARMEHLTRAVLGAVAATD